MTTALMLVIGFIIGCIITSKVVQTLLVGKLRIDRSDSEDGPFMFLELSENIDNIENKKYVVMKVQSENFIPHK